MPLNKQKGNMYGFVTHTWNPIRGRCLHDCSYCYMKKGPLAKSWDQEAHLEEKELKTNIGKGNSIFVGSSTDMWGGWVSGDDIGRVLESCVFYNENHYLFQTKTPGRYEWFLNEFPSNSILGCTIESNIEYNYGGKLLPSMSDRFKEMSHLKVEGAKIAITIEPIMTFDPDEMVAWMDNIKPEWIAIGADSGNNNLDEPHSDKVKQLICRLECFTKVIMKDNLRRIIK